MKTQYPHLTNEQCVELAKRVGGISGSVTDWRRGQSVTDGNLPIGTPISTFMDRSGKTSDRYDGGQGVGNMAGDTTHAGVFAGYQRDAQGNITGMQMWEQYQGSGGAHLRTYPMDDPRGNMHSARNYYAINNSQGVPAGSMNPLNRMGVASNVVGPNMDASATMAASGYATSTVPDSTTINPRPADTTPPNMVQDSNAAAAASTSNTNNMAPPIVSNAATGDTIANVNQIPIIDDFHLLAVNTTSII